MRRREFMAVGILGCASALAQTPRRAKIAILWGGGNQAPFDSFITELVSQLRRVRSKDELLFDIRWGNNNSEEIAKHAADLLRNSPDVIVCGPSIAAVPILRLTSTIPTVFLLVSDPLRRGVVQSISRPSGNATGFSNQDVSIVGKWIQLLRLLKSDIETVGLMISSANLVAEDWLHSLELEASRQSIQPLKVKIHSPDEIQDVIATLTNPNLGLIIPGDTVLSEPQVRVSLVTSVNQRSIPTLFGQTEFVEAGGLFSYDFDKADQFIKAVSYVSRLLDREPISNLPVQSPSKFKLTFNMTAARSSGIIPPAALLALADEVIE